MIVDWEAPWFRAWRGRGERVLQAWQSRPLCEALNAQHPSGVTFVAQDELGDEPYETFIRRTRRVPTRENAHDFFNGLAWLEQPHLKSRLNELQAAEIARRGTGAERGPLRDSVTLLDENGAFLDAPEPLWAALLAREWRLAFVDLRPLWADAQLLVFGHALLEKLLTPRKDLTAHVWCGPREFTPEHLALKPYTPLPVLGVPGWWEGNGNFSFYDDPQVFRAPRRRA
jgi:hypothetical protein